MKRSLARFLTISAVLIGIFCLWFVNAVTFAFHSAEKLPEGRYSLTRIESRIESEVISVHALKGGVLWIDTLVIYGGFGFVFGPFGRVAVMEPGEFPYWHVLSTTWHRGDREKFDFAGHADRCIEKIEKRGGP